ncbi:MAG TPA: gluconate 2-dehydrogenase subunit 3 family protein [Gemmatimonadaceae bacterium]|nr:gluconate 2-dehydrogenase subunit 3 family protein [Gemmatimonadaceae bacterium]
MSRSTIGKPFRAIAVTVVPEAATLTAAGWAEVESAIARALADREPRTRRQVKLFAWLLELAPIARYGRPFSRLDPARRMRVLERVEHSSLLLLRRGMWGLRTLVFLGYYTRPAAAAEIGYRARAGGWSAR